MDQRSARRPLVAIVLAFLSVAGSLLSAAHAQNTVAISPSGVLLKGDPGQTLTGSVRIDNPMDTDAGLTTSTQDFAYDDKGQLTFYPAQSLPTSAASW
ncbi:MAG: hypothetical protein P8Y13_06235, partial [Deinococcales bacterium]